MKATILVIEDDNDILDFISSFLIEHNYTVKSLTKGTKALEAIDNLHPDLILLDLQLPDIKGESVARSIKADYPDLPIIMLTAKSDVADKIGGFKSGADDYMTKPFEPAELLMRIEARLKDKAATSTKLVVSDLELDTQSISVHRGGKAIALSAQEFKLLEYLMKNPGIVLSRDKILSRVWSFTTDVETRVVDVYMGYLRKKIDSDDMPKLIHSVRGFGYMLKDGAQEE